MSVIRLFSQESECRLVVPPSGFIRGTDAFCLFLCLLQPVLFHQEPKTDKDEEYCRKVNEYLNNPPIPGAPGSGGSGGHELSALGGEGGLQNLLGNMSHNQLMQLIGPTGLGGLGELKFVWLKGLR